MTTAVLTTSWDDGHPLDARVAELLDKYGCRGTFFVPQRNSEGRPVLSGAELRSVGTRFEIGSHTRDHIRLDRVDAKAVAQQIADGKRSVEDDLGRPVVGFCYPGGVHTTAIRQAVREAGFRYARTIANFSIAPPTDRFLVPTTIQLFPHARYTYLKNFVSGRGWRQRTPQFGIALRTRNLEATLRGLLEHTVAEGGVFHLWGHSWELDEHGLWDVLETFLRIASELFPSAQRRTNSEIYA